MKSIDNEKRQSSNIPLLIRVNNLIRYHETHTQKIHAVDDVSFDVQKGSFVSIVGASGSGKSTLLSLLAGLDVCTSGEIWFENQPIHSYSEEQKATFRRQSVGFVFQSFQLFENCTALENVQLPLEMRGEQDDTKAVELLNRVGLGSRLGHYPKQLSGGEQQRVALARAFCAKPPLLLADEPTGNLDSKTGAHIMELFLDLRDSFETTVIMVTHDIKISKKADVIYRMEAGKIERER